MLHDHPIGQVHSCCGPQVGLSPRPQKEPEHVRTPSKSVLTSHRAVRCELLYFKRGLPYLQDPLRVGSQPIAQGVVLRAFRHSAAQWLRACHRSAPFGAAIRHDGPRRWGHLREWHPSLRSSINQGDRSVGHLQSARVRFPIQRGYRRFLLLLSTILLW